MNFTVANEAVFKPNLYVKRGETVTFDSSKEYNQIFVEGGGTLSMTTFMRMNAKSVVNNGTIAGRIIEINAQDFVNTGAINATGGGTASTLNINWWNSYSNTGTTTQSGSPVVTQVTP